LVESLVDLVASGLGVVDEPLGIGDFGPDAGLPFLESIDW
jgi:hypothetical protein